MDDNSKQRLYEELRQMSIEHCKDVADAEFSKTIDNRFQVPSVQMELFDTSTIGDCVMHGPMPEPTEKQKEEMKVAWANYIVEQEAEWDRFMSEPSDCTTHGRTIMKNLDGSILVIPAPPEYIDDGSSIWKLNDIGRKRWSNGQSLRDWRCFEYGINKAILKADFL